MSLAYANPSDCRGESRSSRASKRITITIPYSTFRDLESRSLEEGRSLSNLAACLLERALTT
ncbi:hypothetical protein [Synechococcus sp. LA31]|uniref:ribbon-helix-helix domain-containing protein n=1 Tax=Synechococcus sp. LA31 TaxID=2741953 RepID=UPI001BDC61FB|nr:hypothetical protein [Synechococcaceae bacterium WB9_4xB_025]QVV68350.1 hypothetical protein KJJ24_04120 [Synechococcus sp. LA31]